MKKYKVTLSLAEREDLKTITTKGNHKSQKVINVLILLNCDEGEFQNSRSKNAEIADILHISMKKIDLSNNSISEIKGLEKLTYLQILFLRNNEKKFATPHLKGDLNA